MKKKAVVSDYMSESVLTVGAEQSLATAHQLMRDRMIRHLPVLRRGELVGIVSQRDLYLLETLGEVDERDTLVEEAMSGAPYVVPPDAPLEEVLAQMLEHRWGSVVVVERGRIVGLFTTTDAMRALRKLLSAPRPTGRVRHAS